MVAMGPINQLWCFGFDKAKATPWIIGALTCVNVLARVQLEAPLLRVMELTLCRSYYSLNDLSVIDEAGFVEEKLCKIVEVQTQLASFRGWYMALDSIFGLVAAVPYLYFGQTWDRRILILFECLAWAAGSLFTYTICYFYNIFNMNIMYFATLATLFGGSPIIAMSFLNAILAESVAATSLSKILFYLSASLSVTGVVGLSLTATMMRYSLAMPVITGFLVYAFTLPLISWVPEPRNQPRGQGDFVPLSQNPDSNGTDIPGGNPSTDSTPVGLEDDPLPSPIKFPLNATDTIPERIKKVVVSSLDLVKDFYTQCPTATFCLGVFMLSRGAVGVMSYLIQWSSKIHDWSLADMNYVIAFAQVVGSVVSFLLPSIIRLLRWCGFSPMAADLSVARASLFAAALGTCFIGLSWSKHAFLFAMAVFKLSSGFHDALQAYATAVTPTKHITTLYVSISALEIATGSLVEPLWAGVMNVGYKSGDGYDRGPFYVSGLLFLCICLVLFRLKL